MNGAMNPRRRVRQTILVDGHPLILEQPISDQVNQQRRFKWGEAHRESGALLARSASGLRKQETGLVVVIS